DRNRSHWSTSKTPSYTKSVSWQHHPLLDIRYSLSDRIRYYWPHSRIKNSVDTMMVNLEGVDIPLGMISQYLPKQFERIQSGELSAIPHQLIMDKIYDVLRAYRYGCAE
ncbi:class II D-tagatose-bisphosphate aldolase, non-catalytic subunit, partial [Escherichia coli]